jgi:hypothetical protein
MLKMPFALEVTMLCRRVNDLHLEQVHWQQFWGVVFCLDFGHFFFSSLVPLLGIFHLIN